MLCTALKACLASAFVFSIKGGHLQTPDSEIGFKCSRVHTCALALCFGGAQTWLDPCGGVGVVGLRELFEFDWNLFLSSVIVFT